MQKIYVEKIAYIHIKEGKVLITLSRGKDTWYLPGGKRDADETDHQALIREVKEELSIDLIPQTIKYYGTFVAQAHGKPEGALVKMICYTADFKGIPTPTSEIEKIDFFTYAQKSLTAPAAHLIFDDLYSRGLLK